MSNDIHVYRQVEASGEARAEYDAVTFTVTISQKGKSGPAAKAKAKPIVAAVQTALQELEAAGVEIPTDEYRRLTFEVVPNQVYSGGEHSTDGYLANYLIQFRTPTVGLTSLIMDKLTSIPQTAVAAPSFMVTQADQLYGQALADALANALAKFKAECRALGLDADDFGLVGWNVRAGNDRHLNANAAMMALDSPADAPTKIEAGQAKYIIQVYLSFSQSEGLELDALTDQPDEDPGEKTPPPALP